MKQPISFASSVLVIAVAYAALASSFAILSADAKHRTAKETHWYALEYINSDGTNLNSVWYEILQLTVNRSGELADSIVATTPRSGAVTFNGSLLSSYYTETGGDIFQLFGIEFVSGRKFLSEEYRKSEPAAVISESLARRIQEDAQGEKITINRKIYTVVGVFRKSLATPLVAQSDVYITQQPRASGSMPWDPAYNVFIRLRPGVPSATLETRLNQGIADVSEMCRSSFRDQRPHLKPVSELDGLKGDRHLVYITIAGVLIFCVGIANVSGLLIVNCVSLENELKIRVAIGASWKHLYWAAARRGLAVTGCGTVGGLALVYLVLPIFAAACQMLWAENIDLFAAIASEPAFIAANVGLVVFLWVALTVVPAHYSLKIVRNGNILSSSRTVGSSRVLRMVQSFYAAAQVAGTVVMLSFCFFFFQHLERIKQKDVGFDRRDRMKVLFDWGEAVRLAPQEKQKRLIAISSALRAHPQVAEVGMGSDGLLSGYDAASVGLMGSEGKNERVSVEYVSSDYLAATGMRLIKGNWLQNGAKNQIVINEDFARTHFRGSESPVGQFLRPEGTQAGDPGWEVVGVVANVSSALRSLASPKIYRLSDADWGMVNTFIVWSRATLSRDQVNQTFERLDSGLTIIDASSFEEIIRQQLVFEITMARTLAIFGAFGFMVTFLGTIALLSQRVAFARTEYGLRLALGASPALLVRNFFATTFLHSLAGSLLGLAVVFLVQLVISPNLLSVTAGDRWELLSATVGMVLVSLLACIPAVRSIVKVQPSELLKAS